MSRTIHSGNLTFIDLTDSKKVDVHISSNLPNIQIYDVNTTICSPDWTSTPLVLTLTAYADSTDVTNNVTNIKWYRQIGSGAYTQIQDGNTTLQISKNELTDASIGLATGVISYKCSVEYNNKLFENKITFARTDTGRNGTNGVDGTSVNILGSYSTLAELQTAHPTGNAGDAYIVGGRLYVWAVDDASWEDVGNIQGPPGANGKDAKDIVLSGDSQVFKVSKTNLITPSTIKVTAQAFNTAVTNWTYSTNGGQTFLSTVPTGVSRNGNVVTVTGSTITSNSIVIKASDGEVSDVFTVYKAMDGLDGNNGADGTPASIVFLTNENITFSADAQGRIATVTVPSSIVAYSGTTKVTPQIGTIYDVPEDMSVTATTSDISNDIMLSITVTNNSTLGSAKMGTIKIPITSPVSTTLQLNWSKVNAGATGATGAQGVAGSDAYTVMLTNESHTFAGDVSNAIAGSATTQVLAYKGTMAQSVTITSVNGVAASTSDTETGITGLKFKCVALSGVSPTITFTCTTALKAASGSIPIVVSVDGVSFTKMFTYSIAFKGQTGTQGQTGSAGLPATSYWLVSSANVVQKTSIGTIAVTPSTLTFTGKSQTGTNTPTDYACRWVIAYSTDGTNYTDLYTSATNEASKSITMATTYKTIRVRMYLAGGTASLLDEQIIPVVSDGAKGATGAGISSVTVTYGTSTSASTQPTSWQATIPAVAEGSYLWTRTVTDYTDASIADTVTLTYAKQGAKGSTGSAGTSVTVSSIQYQAGASATTAPTGTWSNSVVTVAEGSYLWTKTTFSDGKVAYGVAKQGAKGSAGVNAVTFQIYAPNGYLLSNELDSLTLQTFAYDGSTAITSATYAWSYQENDAWIAISNATTSSLTLTKNDVIKSKTYRCAMTYKNTTYYSTATVQDKSDIYDVMICVSDNINPLTGIYYWVVYALLYSEQGEADALLGPISIDAPASPVSGDYWYAIDETAQTVTLKKYNGSTWVSSTDKQAYAYDWRHIIDGTQQQAIGNTDKVQIISCNSFTSSATFQCIVTDTDGSKLARCNIYLTDTSDPIVSATAPVGVKDGQLWMQTQTDGTFLLCIWDADTSTWKQLNADTKNVVHTTKPSSYKSGDLWVVESDSAISGYTKGTLLQASATTTTFNAAHWSPSLKYEAELSDIQKALKSYRQYMTVDSDGLHMQAKNSDGTLSPFQALFTNTRLSFLQDDLEVAYISDNKLNIYEASIDVLSVEKKIQLQKFEWAIESNGSMSLIVNY